MILERLRFYHEATYAINPEISSQEEEPFFVMLEI